MKPPVLRLPGFGRRAPAYRRAGYTTVCPDGLRRHTWYVLDQEGDGLWEYVVDHEAWNELALEWIDQEPWR